MKYKTILFDADGTLLDFALAEASALSDALAHFSLPDDEETHRVYSAANAEQWALLEQKRVTRAALRYNRFHNFCKALGFSRDADEMADFYENALAHKGFLIDGALELCRTLSKSCDLYIITNGFVKIQTGRFADSPITPYFKRIFISEEIGVEKPDVGFFDYVAREIPDFDKSATLVVGDSLASDIEGGIRAGLATCWINAGQKPIPANKPITHVISSLSELYQIIL